MSSSIKQLQQSHIDLCKVSPIEKNRLIAFVNHFVVSVVKHLNFITNLVDSKLNVLNEKLNVCHSNLIILETKLNSIAGLSSVNAEAAEATQSSIPSVSVIVSEETKTEETPIKKDENDKIEKVEEVVEEAASNEEASTNEADDSDNELLAKFYKMLKIGVPLGAVHQKMIGEGLDPSLLKV